MHTDFLAKLKRCWITLRTWRSPAKSVQWVIERKGLLDYRHRCQYRWLRLVLNRKTHLINRVRVRRRNLPHIRIHLTQSERRVRSRISIIIAIMDCHYVVMQRRTLKLRRRTSIIFRRYMKLTSIERLYRTIDGQSDEQLLNIIRYLCSLRTIRLGSESLSRSQSIDSRWMKIDLYFDQLFRSYFDWQRAMTKWLNVVDLSRDLQQILEHYFSISLSFDDPLRLETIQILPTSMLLLSMIFSNFFLAEIRKELHGGSRMLSHLRRLIVKLLFVFHSYLFGRWSVLDVYFRPSTSLSVDQ